MNKNHLFKKEEETLQKAKSILEESKYKKSPLFKEFSELLRDYKRMYRQLRLLVKMSDKLQQRLNKLNDQLDVRNRVIKKTFGQYLSDDVVDTILQSPEGASLGGEKRVITTLMSDLRGFTAVAESLPAENVVGIINNYLEVMTGIIFKYRGTIEEFIGDGILAVFGAPLLRDDDAKRAVACAVEMQLAVEKVNRRNQDAGYPEMQMGIGINTGEVVVGNIGSSRRTKYGVVGSNVNLTFRIESYSIGGQVLISDSTRKECGPILRIVNRMDVMPKGFKKSITIYEIGGIYGDYNLLLPKKKESRLLELEKSLNVKFSILSGKHADTKPYKGSIVRLFGGEAEILSDVNVDKLSNLKISILDNEGHEVVTDLYAKVIRNITDSPALFKVNFTSVTTEAKIFLEKLISPINI